MHIHIVLCCGAKTVLFTNKLSECCCHYNISLIPTCLQSFMHPSILHKEAYSHCCLLWCEKGIVYQQVIYQMLVSIGSNCPGISGTVPDFSKLSLVPEGVTTGPGSRLDSYQSWRGSIKEYVSAI